MAANPIDIYRRQIEKELQAGNATEHTHRPALKTLIESLASGVTATNEPKRVECGAPDFAVTERRAHGPVTIGHLEAKDVGKDLGEVEKSGQMKRYLPALPNLILTDYLEFRWYVNGDHRQSARLARVGKGGKLVPEKDGAKGVTDLLSAFLSQQAEPINDPKTLALRMARLTHFIRDMIVSAFEGNVASATLRDLRGAFEKALIPDLPIPQFADMFAQTLAYGLFAARVNHHGSPVSFKRLGAASEIPKTNPFLRQLFETITGTALDDEPFAGFVDDLAQLLADTKIEAVLADFGKRTARQDPVVHFYETFLAAYDPRLREARGVYYTPEPVVSYLVRSVDYLLKTRFGCANGLADTATVDYEREEADGGKPKKVKATSPRVLILDPACGTGTFLYSVIDHIRADFMRQENAGMWSGYVRNHLLPRIFGFELLMAPYAVAHFKLGMQLAGHDLSPAQREKWAYDFSGDERLGVYLTNTLEEAERKAETLFGPLRVISQEANAALKIKSELPILAVIGNPPYSNFGGMNNGDWITSLMDEWRPEGERKWNSDDFMKFMRWAQWRLDRTGCGILAFITNNTYIDGITRRRMRETLLNDFSEIYVLNLHGSSRKGETSPGGAKDENVFDIRQGVAIGIFVRQPSNTGPAQVSYCDLWGCRGDKYQFLFENDVLTTKWLQLSPQPDQYSFVPADLSFQPEYATFASIDGPVFAHSNAGIQTKRDKLVYHFSQEELRQVLADVRNLSAEALTQKYELPPDGRDWTIGWAKRDIADNKGEVIHVQYRPFDLRVAYCTGKTKGLMAYPRFPLMASALKKNLLLLTVRNPRKGNVDSFFVGSTAVDKDAVSPFDNVTFFPLYLYPTSNEERAQRELGDEIMRWPQGSDGRRPNLNPTLMADLEKQPGLSFVADGRGDLKNTFGPEDVFGYIYAILHSPTYRTRYAEFLKSDFPHVPVTSDRELFCSLCGLGAELVALHLLESPKLSKPIARYPVTGPNVVEKGFPKYLAPGEPEPGKDQPLTAGRVYISKPDAASGAKGQYFEGVPPEVWNFHIGGYLVCEKWLKDRRGRTLTYDDLEHYCKVVTALSETIRLMAEIDVAIPKWPIE
jgi:hypothetical protein